jgi:hypothetical protein
MTFPVFSNKSTLYIALLRLWTIISGIALIILISIYFSKEEQGFYFAFLNVAAIRFIAELGFGNVLIQYASHESPYIIFKKGKVDFSNNKSLINLRKIFSLSAKYFFFMGLLSSILTFLFGFYLFSVKNDTNIYWIFPWIVYCFFSFVELLIYPIFSILEGCGQITEVYKIRLFQSVISITIGCIGISIGLKLWVLPLILFTNNISGFLPLCSKYFGFFSELIQPPFGKVTFWKEDIWEMQWRMAISYLSGYFAFYFFTPVAFHYYGPIIAGQVGMTLAVTNAIYSFSTLWLTANVPTFGSLISSKNFFELRKTFKNTKTITNLSAIFLSIFTVLFFYYIEKLNFKLHERILPFFPLFLFILSNLFITIGSPFTALIRAHKKELFAPLSFLGGLAIGLSTLLTGKYFSVVEMGILYSITTLLLLFLIFNIYKRYIIREYNTTF